VQNKRALRRLMAQNGRDPKPIDLKFKESK
jgi:hypothetical protein